MFKMITWSQYLGTVAILLVVYYAYVGLVYYRAELLSLLPGQKGKATGGQPAATPTSLLNRGSLIPKAAAVLSAPVPPVSPKEDVTDTDTEEKEAGEETVADVPTDTPGETVEQTQPAPGEEGEEGASGEAKLNHKNDFNQIDNSHVENSVKFTGLESDGITPTVLDAVGETPAEYEAEFMVGVSQLSNCFEQAAEGKLTQEQLTQQVPALANTDVLVAFYKTSTQDAQQLTAATYAQVDEPALN